MALGAMNDLVVRLGATTAGFDKKMRGSQKLLTRFRGAVGGLSSRLMGLSSVFLGLSAGGMAMMIKRNLDLMDSTGKLADRIGITTEKLMGLRHAAELTGAGADTLDAGLTTMAKRLGEAARGAGAAKPALEHIGLAIQDIIALSPDQQFITIAEAISKLPTATERAAAAANIFSKGNMSLINTLAEGRAGLEAMQREAEKLGITFDRETAAKAEDANDALTRLSQTMSGAMTQATADLASQIKDLAEALGKIPKVAREARASALGVMGGKQTKASRALGFSQIGMMMKLWAKFQEWRTGGEYSRQIAGEQKRLAEGRSPTAGLEALRQRARARTARLQAEQGAHERRKEIIPKVLKGGGSFLRDFGGALGGQMERTVRGMGGLFTRSLEPAMRDFKAIALEERIAGKFQQHAPLTAPGIPAGAGQMFSGAKEMDTREAWSHMMRAISGGAGKGVQENLLVNAKEQVRLLGRMENHLADIERQQDQAHLRDIP